MYNISKSRNNFKKPYGEYFFFGECLKNKAETLAIEAWVYES